MLSHQMAASLHGEVGCNEVQGGQPGCHPYRTRCILHGVAQDGSGARPIMVRKVVGRGQGGPKPLPSPPGLGNLASGLTAHLQQMAASMRGGVVVQGRCSAEFARGAQGPGKLAFSKV